MLYLLIEYEDDISGFKEFNIFLSKFYNKIKTFSFISDYYEGGNMFNYNLNIYV